MHRFVDIPLGIWCGRAVPEQELRALGGTRVTHVNCAEQNFIIVGRSRDKSIRFSRATQVIDIQGAAAQVYKNVRRWWPFGVGPTRQVRPHAAYTVGARQNVDEPGSVNPGTARLMIADPSIWFLDVGGRSQGLKGEALNQLRMEYLVHRVQEACPILDGRKANHDGPLLQSLVRDIFVG